MLCFDHNIYPDSWAESVILPLFGKGMRRVTKMIKPTTERYLYTISVVNYIYTSIINNRLQEWTEQNSLTGERQAGFKKDYSTVDHMFTLMAMIQEQFALNRKLYVAFIDFEKAFNSISRKLLWHILLKNGIQDSLCKCVRSITKM